MARFRVRYQGSEFELPLGAFSIGRSAACSLALDDALVSRRHAIIENRGDALVLRDLGSLNGVLVNGERVEGDREIGAGDRLTISRHEMHIVRVEDSGRVPTLQFSQTSPMLDEKDDEDQATSLSDVLTGLADKALSLGRYEEAARMLSKLFVDVQARAATGRVSPDKLHDATSYAIRLADGTKRASWIDWVFEVHTGAGTLMTLQQIDQLHDVVRKTKYANLASIRRYFDRIVRRPDLTPAERFQIQRVEGLLRVVHG